MADTPCSHWWHVPIYLSMSFLLLFISITSLKPSTHQNQLLSSTQALALNASRALRRQGGFHTIATLIHISPELFFSKNQSTIFAIQDSSISNLSISPWEMRQLLHYHTATPAFPIGNFLNVTTPFCFKSQFQNKTLMVTSINHGTRSVMVNNVLISHPDLFLQGPVVIHGVSGIFGMIHESLSSCDSSNQISSFSEGVEWTKVVRFLSSNGFVSFAIGLNTVLDEILQNFENLRSVTIFAPPNSGFISSPSPFLETIMKVHIVNRRFSYKELADDSYLRTLVPGFHLKIKKFNQTLAVNGVEINKPDIFSTKNFVIHGISRAFDVDELSSSF